jgi:type I restriction enzyme M protein
MLTQDGIVKTLYDPACGTGGMLSVGEQYVKELNPKAELKVFGQEINPESYAICKSDMLIKGQNPSNIKFGNTFTVDGWKKKSLIIMLSNPPFGVDWKKAEKIIKAEADSKGMSGRFGAGLPRINDGSLLFLQHMISKMKPDGTRIGIVFNGSPLFTGAAESGESNIRKWIIENDWLEAVIALPDQLFYNTGISTYIWIVTNKKSAHEKAKCN